MEIDFAAVLPAIIQLYDATHSTDDEPANNILLDVMRGIHNHDVAAKATLRESITNPVDVAGVYLLEKQELDIGRGLASLSTGPPTLVGSPASSVGTATPLTIRVFAASVTSTGAR